jgi:hypothetical protein
MSLLAATAKVLEDQHQLDVTAQADDRKEQTIFRISDPIGADSLVAHVIAYHRPGGSRTVAPLGTFRTSAKTYPVKDPIPKKAEKRTFSIDILVGKNDIDREAVKKVIALAQLYLMCKSQLKQATFYLQAPGAPNHLLADLEPLIGLTDPPALEPVDKLARYRSVVGTCQAANEIDSKEVAKLVPCSGCDRCKSGVFRASAAQINEVKRSRGANRLALYNVLTRGQDIDENAKRIDPYWKDTAPTDAEFIYSNPTDDHFLDPDNRKDVQLTASDWQEQELFIDSTIYRKARSMTGFDTVEDSIQQNRASVETDRHLILFWKTIDW